MARTKRKHSLVPDAMLSDPGHATPPPNRQSSRLASALTTKATESRRKGPTTSSDKPSHFLALPRELRDHIYTFAAQDVSAVIHPKSRSKLLSDSPLLRVSRQSNEEFMAALYPAAPVIHIQIIDFDFSSVATFLNRRSQHGLRTLKSNPNTPSPEDRKISINILLTPRCHRNPESLHRWLMRCQDTAKKGADLDFEYAVSIWYDESVQALMLVSAGLEGIEERLRKVGEEGGVLEELRKIIQALLLGNLLQAPECATLTGEGRVAWVRDGK